MGVAKDTIQNQNTVIINSKLLLQAIVDGKLAFANELLQNKETLNLEMTDKQGNTPLIIAAHGYFKIINRLKSAGINAKPLSAYGYFHIVDNLIGAGALVNAQASNGTTALLAASEANEGFILFRLLRAKADRCIATNTGWTPLLMACSKDHTSIVRYLLVEKEDLRQMLSARLNECGSTALIIACAGDNPEIVKLLLEAGANPVDTRKDKCNALHVACEKNVVPIIDLLLENENVIEAINELTEAGVTALAIACKGGFTNLIEKLLKKGADPNCGFITPLHLTCQFEDEQTGTSQEDTHPAILLRLVDARMNLASLNLQPLNNHELNVEPFVRNAPILLSGIRPSLNPRSDAHMGNTDIQRGAHFYGMDDDANKSVAEAMHTLIDDMERLTL